MAALNDLLLDAQHDLHFLIGILQKERATAPSCFRRKHASRRLRFSFKDMCLVRAERACMTDGLETVGDTVTCIGTTLGLSTPC